MKLTSFEDWNCSLAQTMNVIGERWTVLILRDAFFGVTRFDDFQQRLGIARNILTTRLKQLTDEGVLARTIGDHGRPEYRLTDKGYELVPILLAIAQWGDKHKPNPKGARAIFVDRKTGKRIRRIDIRATDGSKLHPRDITFKRGPGLSA